MKKSEKFEIIENLTEQINAAAHFYLTDIETYHDKNGCPKLRLLKKISKNLRFKLSISHDKTKAIAFVIAK